MSEGKTKAGFVTIIGMPNAGKSTLLNSILGDKLSIVTDKPQTTRKQVLGIRSDKNNQVIFLDTPGLLKPRYEMQRSMMRYVNDSLETADIITIIWDLEKDKDKFDLLDRRFEFLGKIKKPKILLLNKIDTYDNIKEILPIIAKASEKGIFDEIIPISAIKNASVDEYLEVLKKYLPESPFYYDPELLSTQSERFFVSELIRENIFKRFREEIPYSTEVSIVEFKEREEGKWFISADIIVEKGSQKGILIGKKGAKIKEIGEVSRKAIEEHLQMPVFLELFVKVREKWRDKPNMLKNMGY